MLHKDRKYCSVTCQSELRQKNTISSWLKGNHSGGSIHGVSYAIKRYLRVQGNDCCSLCKWSVVNVFTGKVPLEVDHIDGDWKNNTPDNLRLICPNCHALTSNYRGRNKGHGRHTVLKNLGLQVYSG